MLNRPSLRFAIISLVLLWVIWALWPTIEYRMLSEEEKEERRSEGTLAELEHRIINLGLDLQGGIHLVLEVDTTMLQYSFQQPLRLTLEQLPLHS